MAHYSRRDEKYKVANYCPISLTCSGVPEGSVLRPIFFLIYINNVAEYTKHSSVRLVADNTISIMYMYLILTAENDSEKLKKDFGYSSNPTNGPIKLQHLP